MIQVIAALAGGIAFGHFIKKDFSAVSEKASLAISCILLFLVGFSAGSQGKADMLFPLFSKGLFFAVAGIAGSIVFLKLGKAAGAVK